MDIKNMPILEGLAKYASEGIAPFHMPGHKKNPRMFEELEFIRENLYMFDNTEVPGLDNLHIPEGMILDAQRLAAKSFHARESYFLVNGSTCGIYSMIMGVTKPGDKIIIQRNCHRSIFMACMLGNLDPVYVNPGILDEFNIAAAVDKDDIIHAMDDNPDAKAIVLTYPTYYGICCDLGGIIREAHKRNILVLVDEAHGAHLPFNRKLPRSSMELGADVSVTSLHKSTPALTQTSLLNVGGTIDSTGIRFMLRLFQSTSPSYIFMASIDAARNIMETRGEGLLDEILNEIDKLHAKIPELKGFKLLGKQHIGKASIFDIDITKIVVLSDYGGSWLDGVLRTEYGIQVEMSDANNIVLISSVGDTQESFKRFYSALEEISKTSSRHGMSRNSTSLPEYKRGIGMEQAYYSTKREIRLEEARGYISAEMVVPYPPGIPILLPGEIITEEIIEYIRHVKSHDIQLNGMNDPNGELIMVVDNKA